MIRSFAAALAAFSMVGVGSAQAAEVLLAKPQMTVASREADMKDCRAIYDGKPRDPAMVEAMATPQQPVVQGGPPTVIVVPYQAPSGSAGAGAGVSLGAAAAGGLFAMAVMAQAEWEKALDLCLRQKGYVVARLTRKELGAFRERVPADQGPYIESLIRSGRLAEATKPLVAPLPRFDGLKVWRLAPGSLEVLPGQKAQGDVIATARAELLHEARLKNDLVVTPKLTAPAGSIFFRVAGSYVGGIGVEPAWCTRWPSPKRERELLCLFDGNNGYNVLVGSTLSTLAVAAAPAAVDLVTTVELVPLDTPSAALPVSFTLSKGYGAEVLKGTAPWMGGEVEVQTETFNLRSGVDKPVKGGAVAPPDVDAGPVEIIIADQTLVITAEGKGKTRRYEATLAAR